MELFGFINQPTLESIFILSGIFGVLFLAVASAFFLALFTVHRKKMYLHGFLLALFIIVVWYINLQTSFMKIYIDIAPYLIVVHILVLAIMYQKYRLNNKSIYLPVIFIDLTLLGNLVLYLMDDLVEVYFNASLFLTLFHILGLGVLLHELQKATKNITNMIALQDHDD